MLKMRAHVQDGLGPIAPVREGAQVRRLSLAGRNMKDVPFCSTLVQWSRPGDSGPRTFGWRGYSLAKELGPRPQKE